MEADSSMETTETPQQPSQNAEQPKKPEEVEEKEADSTIHAFNLSNPNDTVIETVNETNATPLDHKANSCEGSDSGVEVIESVETIINQEYEAVNSAQSCDSSIISCLSNYDEAFNLLVRRNSTLLDDYKLRNVDGTSENGSESSSIASTKVSKRCLGSGKKKVTVDAKGKPVSAGKSKPPLTPKPTITSNGRSKSIDRSAAAAKSAKSNQKVRTKPVPEDLNIAKRDSSINARRNLMNKNLANAKTPTTPPVDDGRWPKTPMTRSLRGALPELKQQKSVVEVKTLEKYATLPRRRKERSADNISELQQNTPKSRESSMNRLSSARKTTTPTPTPTKTLPPYPKKKPPAQKIKIYHETGIQTALNLDDIQKALQGINFAPTNPQDVEKSTKEVQVDRRHEDLEELQKKFTALLEKYERLKGDFGEQGVQLKDAERKLKEEVLEKEGLKEELKNNNERVVAMLGCDEPNNLESNSSDSLMVLETRFQNVSQVILKQEEEISKLNAYCRALQRDFDKSVESQKMLLQQHNESDAESKELHEFMQFEKATLSEALKESESEIKRNRLVLVQKDKELENKQEECKHMMRLSEQRRQENISLQARYVALEAKCRELLVHQGSTVSGAAVALSSLISRLEGLVDELVNSYNISDQELEDVIFHNEAYSNSSSSPDATPDKCRKLIMDKSPSPKRGSSFVSAVINAIRNATAQSPFVVNRENSKDNITDNSDSTELLDSETEPCLMMEHVLEDVIIPDGHSHNMISSCHSMISSMRLSHSESLNSLSQVSNNKRPSDFSYKSLSLTNNVSSLTDLCSSVSLVDQVIDVDNLVTRLLKVIRIIQIENEDYINELQDERDGFCGQVSTQRETNKIVVKQLKDWELLGAKLKTEVKDLLQQLSRKNGEIEDIKNELNQQRKEVEKLNQDVCDLSTALSKSELETKIKEEEVLESLKKWETSGEAPSGDVMTKLIVAQNEVPILKEKLISKEKQLNDLTQEYITNRQVLTESLKNAVAEAKKQYDALDSALETLHSIQAVVQHSPQLLKLQRDLEEVSFQSASAMPLAVPPDYNANAALLQAMATLEIAAPINSTA